MNEKEEVRPIFNAFVMKTITLSALVFLLVNVCAQAQFSYWYGTNVLDDPFALDTYREDGYIIAGETMHKVGGPNPTFPTLSRIDNNGVILWWKTYRVAGDDESSFRDVTSARWLSPNQFAAVGYSKYGASMDDYLVITNPDGTVTQAKLFSNHGADIANHIETYDFKGFGRGYIIAGSTNETYTNIMSGDNNIHVVRTDVNGTLLASAVFSKPLNQEAHWITPTRDQGFLVAGVTELSGSCEADVTKILLIKLNSNLDVVWDRVIDLIPEVGYSSDHAYVVREVVNQEIHIAGTSYVSTSDTSGYSAPFQVHLYADGTFAWAKSYDVSSSFPTEAVSMINVRLSDGSSGYVLGGTRNINVAAGEALMFQTKSNGDPIWGKTYPSNNGQGQTRLHDITPNRLDGYSLTGWAFLPTLPFNINTHLVETDISGSTGGACENTVTVTANGLQACIKRLGLQQTGTMQEDNVPPVVVSLQPTRYSCKEEATSSSLEGVTPNPAQTTISVSGFSEGEVVIYDLHGTVKKKTMFNERGEIDIADLPDGLYMLKLVDVKKGMREFRFIKN
jgi:hypothetical protein